MPFNAGSKPRKFPHWTWEYLLLFGLLAIIVCAVLALLGPAIGNIFSNIYIDNFCGWFGTARAWLDTNGNGKPESGEPPLPNVKFSVAGQGKNNQSGQGESVSDLKGNALLRFDFPGDCKSWGVIGVSVEAQSPSGYRSTTPDTFDFSTSAEAIFGYHDYERDQPVALFGFTYSPGAPTVTPRPPAPKCSPVEEMNGYRLIDIAFTSDQRAWFSTDLGSVFQFSDAPQAGKTLTRSTYIAGINSSAAAPDNTIWVGAEFGAHYFDGSSWHAYTTANGLLNDWIRTVTVAPDNTVWFGSADGLTHFDPRVNTWVHYIAEKGSSPKNLRNVYAIAVAPDNSLWLSALLEYRLYHLTVVTDKGPIWKEYQLPTSYERVEGIAILPDDNLWVAGMSAIYHLDPHSEKWMTYRADGIANSSFSGLTAAPDGTLWLGTEEDGVIHFLPPNAGRPQEAWELYNTEDGLASGRVTKVAFSPEGDLWIGTGNGVTRCRF